MRKMIIRWKRWRFLRNFDKFLLKYAHCGIFSDQSAREILYWVRKSVNCGIYFDQDYIFYRLKNDLERLITSGDDFRERKLATAGIRSGIKLYFADRKMKNL